MNQRGWGILTRTHLWDLEAVVAPRIGFRELGVPGSPATSPSRAINKCARHQAACS
jgi:hypothetical protein